MRSREPTSRASAASTRSPLIHASRSIRRRSRGVSSAASKRCQNNTRSSAQRCTHHSCWPRWFFQLLAASPTNSSLIRVRHAPRPHPSGRRGAVRPLPRVTVCHEMDGNGIAHPGPSKPVRPPLVAPALEQVIGSSHVRHHTANAPLRKLYECINFTSVTSATGTLQGSGRAPSCYCTRAVCAPRAVAGAAEQQAAKPAEAGSDPGARAGADARPAPWQRVGADVLAADSPATLRSCSRAAARVADFGVHHAPCRRCEALRFPPCTAARVSCAGAGNSRACATHAYAVCTLGMAAPRRSAPSFSARCLTRKAPPLRPRRSRLRVLHQLCGMCGGHHLRLVRARFAAAATPAGAAARGHSPARAHACRCGNDPYHAGGYGFTLQGDHNVRPGCHAPV